jgi:hypothetical protein
MFSRTSLFLFGVLLTVGFTPTTVEAATFTLLSPQVVALDGDIELGDCERWKAAVGASANTVILNSRGGKSGQGQCISRSIAARGMKTFVQGRCASICFLLFAAGATKQACEGAKIGVHRPVDATTRQESSDPIFLQTIVDYTARYGVPRAIQERLSATPPKDMYWLNDADLASMNVKWC